MVLLFNLINIGLWIAIAIGIVKGIKKVRRFMDENTKMSKKVDCILNKLEK